MEKQAKLQWHPAFFAGIQIELASEARYLVFENEHQLGTKPKEIDVLIIKKENTPPIRKNIGRIFRTYNLVDIKVPPTLWMSKHFISCTDTPAFIKQTPPPLTGFLWKKSP